MDELNEYNRKRLLFAGFAAILAAGVGFAIRGGIIDNWGAEFGFTSLQIGAILGAGFTGFCFGIILGGLVVDKIGYGKLVLLALICHVLSAVVTFIPGVDSSMDFAYKCLYWGMFIFAFANGTLEAVANPLIARLFPENRAHYLNILHASWPAGLMLGALVGWFLDDGLEWHWKYQLMLYLIPTAVYGVLFMGQKYPQSEAASKGIGFGDMFKDIGLLGSFVVCFLLALFFKSAFGLNDIFAYGIAGVMLIGIGVLTKFSIGSFLLFFLFIAHALVGSVELGTDGWIQNITGNILSSGEGKVLFIIASSIMFILRFSTNFIEKHLKISPIGILFTCSIFSFVGLHISSEMTTFAGALLGLGIYSIGESFFWPTMLAVASDRFPRTGAIAMSVMGGIGMMAAGMIGATGLGYAKDRFSGEALEQANSAIYQEYKAATPSKFLFFPAAYGIDGKKLGEVQERLKIAGDEPAETDVIVRNAGISGDRMTLKADAFIPAAMAVIYLGMLLYFKRNGGYRVVRIAL